MDIVERLRSVSQGYVVLLNDHGVYTEAADEIERLRDNAKQDARYLAAYRRICQKHGFAPSSSKLIEAMEEGE